MAPDIAVPPPRPRRSWADAAVEILVDGLLATEAGLVLFGVLALGIGLPLLVVLGGAAWAARLRRRESPHAPPIALKAVLLTPLVLLLALAILALFGSVSVAAFLSGHPVATALSYLAALATLLSLGYWAVQRRAERQDQVRP